MKPTMCDSLITEITNFVAYKFAWVADPHFMEFKGLFLRSMTPPLFRTVSQMNAVYTFHPIIV
jgi:hypothetical protein